MQEKIFEVVLNQKHIDFIKNYTNYDMKKIDTYTSYACEISEKQFLEIREVLFGIWEEALEAIKEMDDTVQEDVPNMTEFEEEYDKIWAMHDYVESFIKFWDKLKEINL